MANAIAEVELPAPVRAFADLLAWPPPSAGQRMLSSRATWGEKFTPIGMTSSPQQMVEFIARPRLAAESRRMEVVAAIRAFPPLIKQFAALCVRSPTARTEPGSPLSARGPPREVENVALALKLPRAWLLDTTAKLEDAAASVARRLQALLVVEPARSCLAEVLQKIADEVTVRHAGTHAVTLDTRARTATIEPVVWAAVRRWIRHAQGRALLAEVQEVEPRAECVDELLEEEFAFSAVWTKMPKFQALWSQGWVLSEKVTKAQDELSLAMAAGAALAVGVSVIPLAAQQLPEAILERDAWFERVVASFDPLFAKEFGTATPSGVAWAAVSKGKTSFAVTDVSGAAWAIEGGSNPSVDPPVRQQPQQSPSFDAVLRGLQQISDRSSSAIQAGFAGMATASPAASPAVAPLLASPPTNKRKRGKSAAAVAIGQPAPGLRAAPAIGGSSRNCVACQASYPPSAPGQKRCQPCSKIARVSKQSARDRTSPATSNVASPSTSAPDAKTSTGPVTT